MTLYFYFFRLPKYSSTRMFRFYFSGTYLNNNFMRLSPIWNKIDGYKENIDASLVSSIVGTKTALKSALMSGYAKQRKCQLADSY